MPVIAGRPGRRRCPDLGRHHQGRGGARRDRGGADVVNDVSAGRGDPAMLPLVRGSRCADRAHAHAGDARDHAGRAALRGRGRRGGVLPRGAGSARPGRRGSPPRTSSSTRGSGSARPRSTTAGCSRRLDALVALGYPVLVGVSRKSFIGRLLGGRDVGGAARRDRRGGGARRGGRGEARPRARRGGDPRRRRGDARRCSAHDGVR